ncbi:MAG: bifunctional proline dehydrogenase/L-glutamate gamma-semialdehyde dehydrogenase [Candidatus Omnitrophica bacterium]|nr:bifunctional proline dehydrogenase/L-glutamate gamma-semialdehyde dehydrogenase [Candidatus Omnitrophota bacterium]
MTGMIKKILVFVVIISFLGVNIAPAQGANVFTLATPSGFSRMGGPELREAAQLIAAAKEALKDLPDLNINALRDLGPKGFFEKTIFGHKAAGTIFFDDSIEGAINTNTALEREHYLVRATLANGKRFFCIISRGDSASYKVSVATEIMITEAIQKGIIKISHDSIDESDRAMLDDYLDNEENADPWIEEKMKSGEFLVPLSFVLDKRYVNGRGFADSIYKAILDDMRAFLEAIGAKKADEIITNLQKIPLVLIRYADDEATPTKKIGPDRIAIPMKAHSSKYATYEFFSASESNELGMPHVNAIEKIFAHELGARCGLEVTLENGKAVNIFDKYFKMFFEDVHNAERIRWEIAKDGNAEIIENLALVDLDDLTKRKDYAYGLNEIYSKLNFSPNAMVESELFRQDVSETARDILTRAGKARSSWFKRIFTKVARRKLISELLIRFASMHRETQTNIFRFTISLGGIHEKDKTFAGYREHNAEEYARIIKNMGDYLTGKENLAIVRYPTKLIIRLAKMKFISRFTTPFIAKRVLGIVKKYMAQRFFIGEKVDQALDTIGNLKDKGYRLTVDNVGELCLSHKDSKDYVRGYLNLAENGIPKFSVKLSNFTPHMNPNAWEKTKVNIKDGMTKLIEATRIFGIEAEVTIDMEEYVYKDFTIQILLELLGKTDSDILSIAIQSYLKGALDDLQRIVTAVKEKGLPKPLIRLVKGANTTPDGNTADAAGRDVPQLPYKEATDISFDQCAEYMFKNIDYIRPAFATHNPRSMAVVIELARKMGIAGNRFELQFLHGMIQDEIVTAIRQMKIRGKNINIIFYGPFGPFVRGLGYNVRRLVEKTDINSVLRKIDYSKKGITVAIQDPRDTLRETLGALKPSKTKSRPSGTRATRRNPILPQVQKGLDAAMKMALYYRSLHRMDSEKVAEIFLRYRQEVIDLAHWASRSLKDTRGRTNELIAVPRGKVLVIADTSSAREEKIMERIAAPLAAGNKVIVYLKEHAQYKRLSKLFREANIELGHNVTFAHYTPYGVEVNISDIPHIFEVDSISYITDRFDKESKERRKDLYKKIYCRFIEGGKKKSPFIPGYPGYVPGQKTDINFVSEVTPDYAQQFLKVKVFSEVTNRAGFQPEEESAVEKGLPEFKTARWLELFRIENQKKLEDAVACVPQFYNPENELPVVIGDRKYTSKIYDDLEAIPVYSAAKPGYMLGTMPVSNQVLVNLAVKEARKAQKKLASLSAKERARVLMTFAKLAEERVIDLTARIMWESGKTAEEALADVYEGIDFARFYALDAIACEKEEKDNTRTGGRWEGWRNKPNGVSAVISVWNFPFAIPAGQILSAFARGNSVIFKPAEQSANMGYEVVKLLKEAIYLNADLGIPSGAINFLPGLGEETGEALVLHPDTDEIAFTGSAEIGLRIKALAAGVDRGNRPPKHVIAEMGGNNALIVDDSADIETTVKKIVLQSAFGYNKQKCSALHRVIVLESIYEEFCEKLREAASSLIDVMGDPTELGTFLGPLIDDSARKHMQEVIEMADKRLRLLAKGDKGGIRFRIYRDVNPNDILVQREQFFPILYVMKAPDIPTATDILNNTPYALTGGIVTQNPASIEYFREHAKVGNSTVNWTITGAMVGLQAFGGSQLSGFSSFFSKAGGMGHAWWFHGHWVKGEAISVKEDFAHPKPEDEAIRELARRMLEEDIDIFIPQTLFPGDSLAKIKKGLGRVFKDRIRPYSTMTDLVEMLARNPKKAIVMNVELTEEEITAFQNIAQHNNLNPQDVRFMNFEQPDVKELISFGVHENYLQDTLTKLLLGKIITKEEAADRGSVCYRMFAHCLEDYLPEGAINEYILQIVDDKTPFVIKMRNLRQNKIKFMPIEAYDMEHLRPAVAILWSA